MSRGPELGGFTPSRSIPPVLSAAHCSLHSDRPSSVHWGGGQSLGKATFPGCELRLLCSWWARLSVYPEKSVAKPCLCLHRWRISQACGLTPLGPPRLWGRREPKWRLLSLRFGTKRALVRFSNNKTETVHSLERHRRVARGPHVTLHFPSSDVCQSGMPGPLSMGT